MCWPCCSNMVCVRLSFKVAWLRDWRRSFWNERSSWMSWPGQTPTGIFPVCWRWPREVNRQAMCCFRWRRPTLTSCPSTTLLGDAVPLCMFWPQEHFLLVWFLHMICSNDVPQVHHAGLWQYVHLLHCSLHPGPRKESTCQLYSRGSPYPLRSGKWKVVQIKRIWKWKYWFHWSVWSSMCGAFPSREWRKWHCSVRMSTATETLLMSSSAVPFRPSLVMALRPCTAQNWEACVSLSCWTECRRSIPTWGSDSPHLIRKTSLMRYLRVCCCSLESASQVRMFFCFVFRNNVLQMVFSQLFRIYFFKFSE